MTKARRQMQEDLKLIDLIVEIRDARIPESSKNPDLMQMGQNKLRLIILNKADLADPRITEEWAEKYKKEDVYVIQTDSKAQKSRNEILKAFEVASAPKRERDKKRGLRNRPVRAMIVGIPNVGKSTFINLVTKKSQAKTGNKPGVTRGKQWIHTSSLIDLLDTPGILWPKFEDEMVGLRLACTGAIRDEVLPLEELALWLLRFMKEEYPGMLNNRYGITEDGSDVQLLEWIARARGCMKKGDELDYGRATNLLFDDFRSGRLGRITLEKPVTHTEDTK